MNNTPIDAGIPLLTEIIAPAELAPFDENWRVTDRKEIGSSAPIQQASPSTAALSPLEWEKLQLEVHEKILRQLHERIDMAIEQRVRDSLADVLQMTVETMAQQIKIGLHQTLSDVISQAIRLELSQFQKTKIVL